MTRKTLSLILFIASFIGCWAQSEDWYKYPVYTDNIDKVVETADKVYYLSGGTLFSFAPADNENYAYNSFNRLCDNDVKDIYYNPEKDYLLVAYTNSNIDLLFPDGTVVNMPDIKDSSMTTDKGINDVAFGNDRIVVATNFGIVVYSDTRYEVIESGIYNAVINAVAVMNGHILVYGHYATSFSVMAAPVEMRHNTLDKFKKVGGWAMTSITPLDDNHIAFCENQTNKLLIRKIDFNNYSWAPVDISGSYICSDRVRKYKGGYYTYTADALIDVKPDGVKSTPLPEAMRGKPTTLYNDINKIWTGDEQGISLYDISQATPTVLYDKVLCQDYITAKRVGFMRWSADGERLYVSNFINSRYKSFGIQEGAPEYQTTNIIEGTRTRDVSLRNASAQHDYAVKYQKQFNNKRMYGDAHWILEDPDDTDKYYVCNYFEGLYVLKRNATTGEYEEIGKFTEENCPITSNWGQRVLDVNIDKDGNLWVGFEFGVNYAVLPAAKRKQDPKTIKITDWKQYKKLEELAFNSKDMMSLICKKSNMVFVVNGTYEGGFIAIDTKGTYDNPNDDSVYLWNKVTDQDGNIVMYQYITFLLEDERGCVWVGTNAGIFEIPNPSQATDHNMTIRRIKVPRNDGTNYADYLLDSELINWIGLDPANRKWIATDASGIYLVSATGDAILKHYDTSNSPLPSNTVCSIECDKHDNTVYVGTPIGLYSFKSDASAGKDDYTEIYAFPNPVRPEYSGYVTITGLMNNSIVKITDAAGNVVYETRSEGGMATWDACNRSGERVKSGIYYVYASEHNSGNANGAVTKILVIN